MTYPPQPGQPGQPGQPDPYGQYGGQPQSGGFPQQGGYPQGGYPQQGQYGQPQGGYPQGDQYGQQQGGYPQGEAYSQGGGFGGPPPAKGKTGLWIGLGVGGVALLAIGALLFTGFVAPGFFLSDPKAVVDDLAKAITDKDAESAKALICKLQSDDDALTDEDIEKFKTANISMKVLGDAKEISDTEAHVPAEITFEGLTQTGDFVVKDENGWCVSTFKNSSGTGGGGAPVPSTANSVDPPSTGSSGASDAATSLAQQFIDEVNSGDKSGATSLVCDSSKDLVGSSLDRAISDGISAKMKSTPSDSSSFVIIELEGERDGRSASGNMGMSSNDSGATWCVLTFHMF